MVEVLKEGKVKAQIVKCKFCKAELKVRESEWEKGDYGSQQIITCPCCAETVVRPGTDYTGDF